MKTFLLAGCSLFLGLASLTAATITSAGVDGTDGGVLTVDGTDDYWWFCVQPDGSRGPLAAGPAGYTADVVSLDYGWTRQTTERFAFISGAAPEIQAEMGQQVNAIEYILDNYLPWADTTDRFLENAGLTDQTTDNDFLNRFYAVHAYVKELYFKPYTDSDSTGPGYVDLFNFEPVNPWDTLEATPQVLTPAEIARQDFFDQIRAEVKAIALAGGLVTYEPIDGHQYTLVNTEEIQGNALDWQDVLLVGVVPEPSTGLLAVGSLFLLGLRRSRRA